MHVHAKPMAPQPAAVPRPPKAPASAGLSVAPVPGASGRGGGGAPNRRAPRDAPERDERDGQAPGRDAAAAFAARLAAMSLGAEDGTAAPFPAEPLRPGGPDIQALIAEAVARR